jgi:MAST domain-containing protein
MKRKLILIGIFFVVLLAENVAAENPYGKIYTYDVYYNDKLLPGTDVAKPILKIGEPFSIGFYLTVYQKCYVYTMLSEIGDNDFEIVTGSTSKMKDYGKNVLDKNSSKMFNWTVKPTDSWAGGSLPLNIVYQLNDFEIGHLLTKGKFTVAYCTISNEHYKGEVPTSKEQKVSETETSPTSKTASMPGFSLVTTIAALALVFLRSSRL